MGRTKTVSRGTRLLNPSGVRFDPNGDVVSSAITILRVRQGGEGMSRDATEFADGVAVDRATSPPTQSFGQRTASFREIAQELPEAHAA